MSLSPVAVAVTVTVTRGVPCPVPDVVISRVRHDSNGTLIRYSHYYKKCYTKFYLNSFLGKHGLYLLDRLRYLSYSSKIETFQKSLKTIQPPPPTVTNTGTGTWSCAVRFTTSFVDADNRSTYRTVLEYSVYVHECTKSLNFFTLNLCSVKKPSS